MRSSLLVLAALVLWMGSADAGRKRLVVLEFDGPKADKFHADVVKLLKKKHTVLSVDKWVGTAEDLEATAVTNKNVKKVAKKLKIDGVVTGRIEKRRDEYIVRLKVRSGVDGTVGGSVQTKSDSPRLDARAKRDLKDELMPVIDDLDSVRGGGDDDEEEEEEEDEEESGGFVKKGKMSQEDPKALAKKKKAEEAEAKRLAKEEEKRRKEEEKRAKEDERRAKEEEKRLAKEEEKRKKEEDKRKKAEEAAFAKRKAKKEVEEEDEEADEEEEERPRRKRTARRDDDDDEGIEEEIDLDDSGPRDLSVANRVVDAVIGMSFTARQLTFSYAMDLAKPPPGYKQPLPVAGAVLDVTVYPLAMGKTKGILRGLGLTAMYDKVLIINSRKRYSDEQGMQRIANLDTAESRWAIGPVLRYPMGKLVVGGSLTYGKQQFTVAQTLPNNQPTDIPSVEYTMFTPTAFLKYPLTSKINVNADASFHGITNTGQIQQSGMTGYGAATVTGYQLEGGADYMVTKNIFARASVRYQSIGFKFKGDPTSQTNVRDTDPEQDVMGASDVYFGGTVTVGYVY